MKRNEPVNIQPVGNGFLVEPGHGARDPACMFSRKDQLVFQTFTDLNHYLAQHFDQPELEEENDR